MIAINNILDQYVEKLATNYVDKYGKYHSDHEFYAVLTEEIEEAYEDIESMISNHMNLWDKIRINSELTKEDTDIIRNLAYDAINELLQVAAICDKYSKR